MSEISSGEIKNLINPQYKEVQNRIIEHLHVGSVSEVLPNDICALYGEYKDQIGKRNFGEDNSAVVMRTGENGVISITKGHKENLGRRFKNVEVIDDYYVVDSVTGKACNLAQLWRLEDLSELTQTTRGFKRQEGQQIKVVFLKRNILGPYALPKKDTVYVVVDFPTERIIWQLLDSLFYRKRMKTSQNIFTFHESGHAIQMVHRTEEFKMKFRLYRLLALISSLVPLGIEVPKMFPRFKQVLEQGKQAEISMERNAEAFAYGITRKLKHEGVDVLRGIGLNDVFRFRETDFRLRDIFFAGIEGQEYSSLGRRMAGQLQERDDLRGKALRVLFRTREGRAIQYAVKRQGKSSLT